MPRWRQDSKTGKLVPIDRAARERDGVAIHGDIEAFVSPIDGSVISDRKQYREHMEKHGVVPAAEFSPEFYARKAQERADFFEGKRSKEETFKRKQEIYDIIERAERNG